MRMARAGARIIGVNCLYDPFCSLETLRLMKADLDEAGDIGIVIHTRYLIISVS